MAKSTKPTKHAKKPDTKPDLTTVIVCLFFIVVAQAIAAFTKSEVPIAVFAIIAGILFGVGKIGNIFGGGK